MNSAEVVRKPQDPLQMLPSMLPSMKSTVLWRRKLEGSSSSVRQEREEKPTSEKKKITSYISSQRTRYETLKEQQNKF